MDNIGNTREKQHKKTRKMQRGPTHTFPDWMILINSDALAFGGELNIIFVLSSITDKNILDSIKFQVKVTLPISQMSPIPW